MERQTKTGYFVLGLIALVAMMSIFAWAESSYPFGAREVNYVQSSRANVSAYPPDQIEAEAGNVTELSLVGISVTNYWQGYYGNISGIITLEDINGNVFYNWTANEPKGEVFASRNQTIVWADIKCFNWTDTGSQIVDLESAEDWYSIGDDAADGINETFRTAVIPADIMVGNNNISRNATDLGITCHTANPYQFNLQDTQTDNFLNFLLTDDTGTLVFAGVIENNEFNNITDPIGYDNIAHDFQLLVAEDGSGDATFTTTTYYFWLELS